jgi:hypothetical protein
MSLDDNPKTLIRILRAMEQRLLELESAVKDEKDLMEAERIVADVRSEIAIKIRELESR